MGAALSLVALGGCGAQPPEGAVLIVVDTLRADHMGVYGYERDTTPQLDRLAADAAIFESVWSSSSWTLPTVASLLTGRSPSAHGAGRRLADDPRRSSGLRQRSALAPAVPTLTEVVQRAGLATAAVASNPFLAPRFGLSRGFDSYDNVTGRRADEIVDRALGWLDERAGSRFFLLVHLMDPHLPYDAPVAARHFAEEADRRLSRWPLASLRRIVPRLSAEQRDGLIAAYDEEIAFVDDQLARLFDELATSGRLESLLVVLTSDHGEELFDHGYFEHGHALHDELLRVPLLIWGPGVRAGRENGTVSVVDVAPTILEALGIAPTLGGSGRSLWPRLHHGAELAPRRAVAEQTLYGVERRALVDWPYKLVLAEGDPVPKLYDLERDPEERSDLAGERSETAERMLTALRRSLAEEIAGTEAVEIDEALLEELRALGYVE